MLDVLAQGPARSLTELRVLSLDAAMAPGAAGGRRQQTPPRPATSAPLLPRLRRLVVGNVVSWRFFEVAGVQAPALEELCVGGFVVPPASVPKLRLARLELPLGLLRESVVGLAQRPVFRVLRSECLSLVGCFLVLPGPEGCMAAGPLSLCMTRDKDFLHRGNLDTPYRGTTLDAYLLAGLCSLVSRLRLLNMPHDLVGRVLAVLTVGGVGGRIRHLELQQCALTLGQNRHLRGLAALTALRSLRLDNCRLGDDAADALVHLERDLPPGVRRLEVALPPRGSGGARWVGECLDRREHYTPPHASLLHGLWWLQRQRPDMDVVLQGRDAAGGEAAGGGLV